MADFEHKLLEGQGAGKWLPFARQKVAALHARAKAMRVNSLVQRWTVEGGDVSIKVSVSGDQRYIHIKRVQCPPFLSGFLDWASGSNAFTVEIPNPDPPPPDTIEVFRRFYPSPATPAEDREWRDEPGLIDSGPQMVSFPDSVLGTPGAVKASMFSSEMRKVVQVLHGMNFEVNYTCTAASSAGIFRAENGQRWIIEISNTGVVAWAMGMCRNPILSRTGEVLLEYTPLYTPKPTGDDLAAAIEAGTFVTLSDAAGLSDFYTKSPYSSAISWAFSGDGHEAANVCTGSDGHAPIGFLYKVNITEIENRPVSAALTEAEHGYLGIDTDRCHMKYPVAAGDKRLFSYDTGIYLPVNTNAPVYCFYDGPVLVIFRVVYAYGSNVQSGSEETGCGYGCPASFQIPPNEAGASYLASGSITTGEVPHFESNVGSNPSGLTERNYNATLRTRSVGREPIGITTVSSQCAFNFGLVFEVSGSQTSLQGAEIVRNVLAVPAYDREAVYIGGKLDGSPVIRTAFSAFASIEAALAFIPGSCSRTSATYVTSPDEECTGHPGTCVSVNLGGGIVNAGGVDRCDNGVRPFTYAGCAGSAPYYPYVTPFQNGTQDGSTCVLVGGAQQAFFSCQGYSDNSPISILPLSATTIYFGSGGANAQLDPRVAQNLLEIDFYQFSEFLTPLISIRDAFDGEKFIISPDLGKFLGSDTLSSADDYPVVEAGAGMAFVGVP